MDPRLRQTSGGGVTTQFLYDGDDLVAEYDQAGSLLRRYVHGEGDDEPMVWFEGSALASPRYLQADANGSVTSVADGAGNLLAINSYDAYGVPGTGALSRFGYTGQIYLPEIGLWHYKARAYSPVLGRFLQTDPIGDADDPNLYAYVGNDPNNNRDPSGLFADNAKQWTNQNVLGPTRNAISRAWTDQGTHAYSFSMPLCDECTRRQAFDVVRSFSAPGARYARDGKHTQILTSNNPITQTVDPIKMTILNETQKAHVFYPGTVTISIVRRNGVVSMHVNGYGTGPYRTINQYGGRAIFTALGVSAYGALNTPGLPGSK